MKIRGVVIIVECDACDSTGEVRGDEYANLVVLLPCSHCGGRGAITRNISLKELAEALRTAT